MDRLRMFLLSACLLLSLFYPIKSSPSSVIYWNAASWNVSLPNHFSIDEVNGVLVIAANNSVCHLSFDFTNFTNVLLAGPDESVASFCIYRDARDLEECQNYHHVIQFPQGPGDINNIPLNQTVLTCGSNAFSPRCSYRMRDNLQVIRHYPGADFCSVDMTTDTTSLWISNNRLVSASRTPIEPFGIRISESPYTGTVAVETRPNDNFWINRSPHFVSMYEIGEHIYIFFREEAVEVTEPDKVIYSRVARVCKNDVGSNDPILGGSGNNVFLTFIKARMSCSSGSGIPFHYNNIQDTFLLQSGSYDGKTDSMHLYAVFTSSENGPVGSAVCVYTFYSQNDDLGNVFSGNYKKRSPIDGTVEVQQNFDDFSCEANSRTVQEARDIQFMEDVATQSNEHHPLLKLGGYTFSKIVVDQTTDADGIKREVMFVTAHKDGQLFLIKGVYADTDEDMYHVISTTRLGADTRVTKMLLNGSGADAHIFIGTENGIYRVPTADCARFTDCCSCVSARDPYCTYELESHTCVAVESTDADRKNLLQDFDTGNSSLCYEAAVRLGDHTSSSDSLPSSNGNRCFTGVATPPVAMVTEDDSTNRPTFVTVTIASGGLTPTDTTSKVNEHIWTIVGSVSGFVGGVVIGIILMAFFYQRGNVFLRKTSSRRRPGRRTSQLYRYDVGDEGKETLRRCKTGGAAESCKKGEEYLKNNSHELSSSSSYPSKSNDYTNPPPKASVSNRLVNNPVPTTKGASSRQEANTIVLNPPPTKKGASSKQEDNIIVLKPPPAAKCARQEMVPNGNGAAAISKYCVHSEPMVGKGSSIAVVAVEPPTFPKTKSASALRSAAPMTSYGRRMTSSGNHSDLNLKSNQKLEESLTNHDRDAYGRNLLARQPSIDTSNKLSHAINGRTRPPAPVLQVSYDRRLDFVSLSDVPRTSSQC